MRRRRAFPPEPVPGVSLGPRRQPAALLQHRGHPPEAPHHLPRDQTRIALRRAGVRHGRHRGVRARGLHPDASHGHLAPRPLHREPHGHVRARRLPLQHRHGDDDAVRTPVALVRGGRGMVPDGRRRRPRGGPRSSRAPRVHSRHAPTIRPGVHPQAHGDGAHDGAERVRRRRRVRARTRDGRRRPEPERSKDGEK